jgi:hypothetical protein
LSPRSAAAVAVALAALAAAPRAPAQTRAEKIAAAAERWFASEQSDRAQLDALVELVVAEPKDGIAWLGAELAAVRATPTVPRAKAVRGLVTHVALEVMRRQRATGITFQGQYAGLQPLQPEVGEFLFELLLATPDWFPTTHRIHVVPALRDLQANRPDAARVEGIVRIVENDAIEPESLRRALAALLWQWGDKKHAQDFVQALVKATGEGDGSERVLSTLELADYYTALREYKQAAGAHRAAQVLASRSGVTLKPVSWYAAACVFALQGDTEHGIAAIEECVRQLASPHLDSSLRLPRTMFDSDPELANLRAHARWNELMRIAFPANSEPPSGR